MMVHNRYRQRGGEDHVFEAECGLIESRGHVLIKVEFSNNNINVAGSLSASLQLAKNTVWSNSSAAMLRTLAMDYGADVVHLHNIFPLPSPSAYSAVAGAGSAVVQTLHNFRLLCPNALFYRDEHVCEDCLGKTPPLPGIVHACYRDSRAQTAVVATMLTAHRIRRTWHRDVDRYIALNPFSMQKFIEGGLPEDRIVVKPNFVDGPATMPDTPREAAVVSVGRLSEEKGIATLLNAWSRHADLPPVNIVGDGPMIADARSVSSFRDTLRLLGRQPRTVVMDQLSIASALVFPSVCYENFPVAIAEAFANGTPVIASRLGAMAEVVEDGVTGLLFTAGDADDLAAKVRWAIAHPDEMHCMGINARREYEAKYSPDVNHALLMDIYQQAILHMRQKRPE